MWLFTSTGFVSAVRQGSDLVVRSRDAQSLEPIATFGKIKIQHTPANDYPYRITTDNDTFARWTHFMCQTIEYSNFKSEVALTRGSKFAKALAKVWSDMHDVEDKDARSGR
jgi:hypothetical protein